MDVLVADGGDGDGGPWGDWFDIVGTWTESEFQPIPALELEVPVGNALYAIKSSPPYGDPKSLPPYTSAIDAMVDPILTYSFMLK